MEAAKRRLFYTLDLLGLSNGSAASGFDPPLAFDFKADSIPRNEFWRAMNKEERVYTSYVSGKLTINIREAEPAERESIRVELDEAHRTLLGHLRHEIGHYYRDLLVKAKQETDSTSVFGDHENPSYAEALDRHYREGAPSGWEQNFISAYATMHPWEDFAGTFAAYLELTGVLHTANHIGLGPVPDVRTADFPEMVNAKRRLSVAVNEMNRAMGLTDFYPKVLVTAVVEKMRFVHELVRSNSAVSGRVD